MIYESEKVEFKIMEANTQSIKVADSESYENKRTLNQELTFNQAYTEI